jgi:HEAT repeat protein
VDEAFERLTAVVTQGSDEDMDAWASTGRAGVLILRDALQPGFARLDWEGLHDRDVLDGLATAFTAIAARHPDEFLQVFEGAAFDENTFVLDGLGHIDDARATARLVSASASRDHGVRMHAAIGLGGRPAPEAREALLKLQADPDFLVRHHASQSLAAIGRGDSPSEINGRSPG